MHDVIHRYEEVHNHEHMPEKQLYRGLAIFMKQHARINNAIELAQKMELICVHRGQGNPTYSTVDPDAKPIPIEKYTMEKKEQKDNSDDWGGKKL